MVSCRINASWNWTSRITSARNTYWLVTGREGRWHGIMPAWLRDLLPFLAVVTWWETLSKIIIPLIERRRKGGINEDHR